MANYILNEIKKNVKSQIAEQIRYFIDAVTYRKRMKDWENGPWYTKVGGPPQLDLISAMAIWFQAVRTGANWDHKHIIRDKFGNIAAERPLGSGSLSKSYYHRYREHDYFMMYGLIYIMDTWD